MNTIIEKFPDPPPDGEWGLLDLLAPVQLGVLYESLMKNANEGGLNAKSSADYLQWAEWVKSGIDYNCGWDDYEKGDAINKPLQPLCRRLADYDNRMGWNP